MTKEELAKWLHDNYEAVAKEQDWNTQQSCKVEFDTLPDANKRTMIEIADRLLNFNLLRLHFVVGQSEQLPEYEKWIKIYDAINKARNKRFGQGYNLGVVKDGLYSMGFEDAIKWLLGNEL
jgi:hypothetical protein